MTGKRSSKFPFWTKLVRGKGLLVPSFDHALCLYYIPQPSIHMPVPPFWPHFDILNISLPCKKGSPKVSLHFKLFLCTLMLSIDNVTKITWVRYHCYLWNRMPVLGTNSHPWRYQWSRSRAVHYGVRYGFEWGAGRFTGQLEPLPESARRHHEAWIDYSSVFTLRDTTCHEVVKYVFSLIARLFSDQGSVVLCFLCLDCYKQ